MNCSYNYVIYNCITSTVCKRLTLLVLLKRDLTHTCRPRSVWFAKGCMKESSSSLSIADAIMNWKRREMRDKRHSKSKHKKKEKMYLSNKRRNKSFKKTFVEKEETFQYQFSFIIIFKFKTKWFHKKFNFCPKYNNARYF